LAKLGLLVFKGLRRVNVLPSKPAGEALLGVLLVKDAFRK